MDTEKALELIVNFEKEMEKLFSDINRKFDSIEEKLGNINDSLDSIDENLDGINDTLDCTGKLLEVPTEPRKYHIDPEFLKMITEAEKDMELVDIEEDYLQEY
jgi:DNA repair ATPase RecN